MFQLEKEFINEFVLYFLKYINKKELDEYLFLSKEIPLDCIFELDEHISNLNIFSIQEIGQAKTFKYRGLANLLCLDLFFETLNEELSNNIEEQINNFIHDHVLSVINEDNFKYFLNVKRDTLNKLIEEGKTTLEEELDNISKQLSDRLSTYILKLSTNIMLDNIKEDIRRILEIFYTKEDVELFIEDILIYNLVYPINLEEKMPSYFKNILKNTLME